MRALILAAMFAPMLAMGMARAETVSVTSGEHDEFTRIVVDLAVATPWQVGRTVDGYALRFARDDIRYDLTEVFDAIPRTRLAAIWADPDSGDLRFGIGCTCHVIAFEFRENVIVVDIRDGPPPPGSAFEQSLDGRAMPKLAARDVRRPQARPADLPPGFTWTRLRTEPATERLTLPPAVPAPLAGPTANATASVDLDALRATLLQQLSRGAAQGLVNMTLPMQTETGEAGQVVLQRPDRNRPGGPGPGLSALTPLDPVPELTERGDLCVEESRLAVPDWADDRPYAVQTAEARGAMLGEFDRPDPEAVGRFVRQQIHFGFGLEARVTLRSLAVADPDAALWETMARIVDGEPVPPDHPFAGQEDCQTAAAFWAVLARPELRRSDRVDRPAVLRSFSALPIWLRRSLGPGLAERFLAIGDTATARTIRDAILRAPGDPGPATRLVEAQIDLVSGRGDAAVAQIEDVARDAGPMLPQAMIDLVEARLAQGSDVDPETVEAIAALAAENRGGPLGPPLRRAEALARAAGGDFAAAFAISAETVPGFDAELWPLLAARGSDAALLELAVRPPGEIPETQAQVHEPIAARLIGLGFPEAGLAWLPPVEGRADLLLLAARAELLRRDARAALRLLAGQPGAEADRLRAEAQLLLGDTRAAAATVAAAGDAAAAERLLWQARDWAAVAATGADPQRQAAAALALPTATVPLVLPTGGDDGAVTLPLQPAPLARGRALVEDSAAARAALLAMLAAVPAPDAIQP